MRRTVALVTAAAFAVLGPRMTTPHDRAAGEPFVYTPPPGFAPVKGQAPTQASGAKAQEGATDEREWAHRATEGQVVEPHVHLKLSRKGGTVESADLRQIAEGMPGVLAPSGVTWTDVRHETRTRSDGARVGIIEGESTKQIDGFGGARSTVRYRRLLIVFPTDEGAGLVTAIYANDEVAKWQPAFEATIGTAKGVALRVPHAPGWVYLAWAVAGAVLGWLAASLAMAGKEGKKPSPDSAVEGRAADKAASKARGEGAKSAFPKLARPDLARSERDVRGDA